MRKEIREEDIKKWNKKLAAIIKSMELESGGRIIMAETSGIKTAIFLDNIEIGDTIEEYILCRLVFDGPNEFEKHFSKEILEPARNAGLEISYAVGRRKFDILIEEIKEFLLN